MIDVCTALCSLAGVQEISEGKKKKPKQQIWGFLLNKANRKIHQKVAFASWSPSSIISEFRASDLRTFSANTVSLYGRKLCLLCGIAFVYRGEQPLVAVAFTAICQSAQRANMETTGFSSAGKHWQPLETLPTRLWFPLFQLYGPQPLPSSCRIRLSCSTEHPKKGKTCFL